jgi:plasmid stabilization system protein ParE
MFMIYRSKAATRPLRKVLAKADPAAQARIRQAVEQLNERLADQPQEQGESRGMKTRIIFEAPVAILFEVDEAKMLVTVLRTWAYRSAAQETWPEC